MGLGERAGALRAAARILKAAWRAPLARFCVILFAALSALVPVITASAVKIARGARNQPELPAGGGAGAKLVEADELFLPDEPDFLPPALLRREPLGAWQAGDAAPYWADPGAIDNALWLDQIEKTIDSLLEHVR